MQAFVPSLQPVKAGNLLLVATRRDRIRVDDWRETRASLEPLPIRLFQDTKSRYGVKNPTPNVDVEWAGRWALTQTLNER